MAKTAIQKTLKRLKAAPKAGKSKSAIASLAEKLNPTKKGKK